MTGYSEAPELDDVQARVGAWLSTRSDRTASPRWLGVDALQLVRLDYRRRRAHSRTIALSFESYWHSVESRRGPVAKLGRAAIFFRRSKAEVVRNLGDAPKPISLARYRDIPDEPHDSGKLVFSVMGSDITMVF